MANRIAEAIRRMKKLNLHENVIRDFEKDGTLNCSEEGMGILFWLYDEKKQAIKDIEDRYDILVYHCTLDYLEFGRCLTCLYVSSQEDEWAYDDQDLILDDENTCYPIAYVANLDDDTCSEFGSVGIRPMNGGVVRVA